MYLKFKLAIFNNSRYNNSRTSVCQNKKRKINKKG